MNKKRIELTFDLEQVCNDVLAKCNLISESIKEAGLEDIKANVAEPDNPETRSIINRAVTEAFGRVKVACQRYLTVGRTEDNNQLERLVKSVTYAKKYVEVEDDNGNVTEELVDSDEIATIEYESVLLVLEIPNFNLAVTDDLKSAVHKFVVDYVMGRFLQDQVADKAAEYKELADGEDYRKIVSDLNCRDRYTMRRPSFM